MDTYTASTQVSSHMWHHEDAGVGFNVIRNGVARGGGGSGVGNTGGVAGVTVRDTPNLNPNLNPNLKPNFKSNAGGEGMTHMVAVPGHYNDPYIVERTRHVAGRLSPDDEYWSQVNCYASIFIYVYVCMHIYIHVCIYVCICIYVYIYTTTRVSSSVRGTWRDGYRLTMNIGRR